ncbi:transglutaminase family protein [Lentibacillus sp. CBA3610]|uniref:transglutaminase-like domain-containing protein n=1 Tax=Lentibacillus sp. CBA3610 TaxID=2518176 RepID=UPI001595F169|nr:transglutaminase family protein [Lentibacillus sp. CBA3610]QKY70560.1 transglutaminase family protein [Lentibacillus sp. CBA3610]
MELVCESGLINDYLCDTKEINYSHPKVQEKITELFNQSQSEIEKAEIAFKFVRDQVDHSWDIKGERGTCDASDTLNYREGICYAKSNLLAALLRSQNISTGFCYQRLMLFDTPEKGYCIHALNAIFLSSKNKWIRIDARGNKKGIDAQFSIDEEKLAFKVNEDKDEKDYPMIYVNPHPKTLSTLRNHTDAVEMYKHYLPAYL